MKKPKRIVAANWKMNPDTLFRAKKIFEPLKRNASKFRNVNLLLLPPFPYLAPLRESYKGKSVAFGAQDVFPEPRGSFTGEVSPLMLQSVGATHILVGHSERRALGDTDEKVEKKLRAALDNAFSVILCIGERERDHGGHYLGFLRDQIVAALKGVTVKELKGVTIAYEPIFAIGKSADNAMKPFEIHETVLFIRRVLTEMYDRDSAFRLPILYGGSVEVSNAEGILRDGEVQGFLVGHASLVPDEFLEILRIADRT